MSWSIQSAGLAGEALETADREIGRQILSISDPVEQEHAQDVRGLLGKVLSSIPQQNAVTVQASGSTSDGIYWLKLVIEPKAVSVTAIGKAPAK